MNNIWTSEYDTIAIYENMKINEQMTHAYFFRLWEADGPDGS